MSSPWTSLPKNLLANQRAKNMCFSFKNTDRVGERGTVKVINVESDTFGNPIFQKGLQN